jgi:cellulose synthase/poly-beta-1,6-N-acetylglucosamine synthase-like glycosyltransferase
MPIALETFDSQPSDPNHSALHVGHWNVKYCGDRIKRGQMNGKSANLNHAILTKLYPNIRRAADIPEKDIIMIMDCDHMVKPQIFMKMGACMLDRRVAVTLVPQVPISTLWPVCSRI